MYNAFLRNYFVRAQNYLYFGNERVFILVCYNFVQF